MKYKQIEQILDFGFKALEDGFNYVYGYRGEPGTGKTQKLLQYAKNRGYKCIQIVGSCLSPTDIAAPMPGKEGYLEFYFNNQIPWEDLVGDEKVLWFIDEATNIHPETWKSGQKLINERELMGKKLGKNVLIVLAMNRSTDKAGSGNLTSAVSNRISFYDMQYDNDEFLEYLEERYDCPPLITYLTLKPLDPSGNFKTALGLPAGEPMSWANPRTVERVAYRFHKVGHEVTVEDMKADVGIGWATEFKGFLSIINELPNVEKITNNPKSVPVPDQVNKQYALTAMLSQYVNKDNITPFKEFMQRMDITLQLLFVRLLKKKPELFVTKAYTDWIMSPQMQKAVLGK